MTLYRICLVCFFFVFTTSFSYGQNTIRRPGDKKVVKKTTRSKPAVKGNTPAKPMSTKAVVKLSQYAPQRYPFRHVKDCPLKDILNPMDGGIILGWTTVDEAIAAGGYSKPRDDGQHTVNINERTYWDHEGDGIITSLYFTHSKELPDSWQRAGLSFSLSYKQWYSWLENHGFTVYVKKAPSKSGSFTAELEAINLTSNLRMGLDFNYSNNTSATDANTLYSITLKRPRIHTSKTSYAPYFPIEGVMPGVTTIAQLSEMGMDISSFGDNNEFKYGKMGDIRFYNDKNGGNVVCSVDIDSNLLLQQWAKAGESRFMSYNKWMSFFKEHDFIVMRNDLLQDTSARYPRVKAIHPYLGLLIELEFKKSFSISEEGDSPTVFDEYSIEIL